MPRYNYACDTCTVADYLKSSADGLAIFIDANAQDAYKEPLVWEEVHEMAASPEIRCMVCGAACSKTFLGVKTNFMITGNFALNTAECKMLANIDRLKNDDPYAHMRQSGEVDDKVNQFKKSLKTRSNWKRDKYQEGKKAKRKPKSKIDLGNKQRTTLL
jgi:predicted nucleic acid-binding Zn ribbon protein